MENDCGFLSTFFIPSSYRRSRPFFFGPVQTKSRFSSRRQTDSLKHMNALEHFVRSLALFSTLFTVACNESEQPTVKPTRVASEQAKPVPIKRVPRGQNVWLEVQGSKRRVIIDSYVCLREGL